MAYYKDLREHIAALEAAGKLVRIKREINKDTELMPLVRWQFRGLPEEQRKAFLFEKVVDVKGKRYDMPVLVASHAASRDVYALALRCRPEEIAQRWAQAQLNPIEPKLVNDGPVHEHVYLGDRLLERGGLGQFPVPISTPGFDPAPYITHSNWVTKDPETGVRNMGNYRAMIKSRTRLGISGHQHYYSHWLKCKSRGIPLQAALIIGASPNIGLVAPAKVPYDVDEYAVAGGLAGEPVELVKCKTVDIEVPANAEIVIEGELPTDTLEREAPFGEVIGYVGTERIMPYFNVTCITHRTNPIYNVFISQLTPNESSKLQEIANAALYYKFLKYDCGIAGILDVAFQENSGSAGYCVIRLKKLQPGDARRALNALTAKSPTGPKVAVAVDEDIDPKDADAVNWAISYRALPRRDTWIIDGKFLAQDYSGAPLTAPEEEQNYPPPNGGSTLLIDATLKWDYPPVSLPRKEFMERARAIWEEEGLPKLKPKSPWYGYSLGYWSKEHEEEAELALKGEHYQTGEKLAKQRVKS